MKKYLLLIAFAVTLMTGYAQTKISDLKSGKHLHHTLVGNINGVWKCKNCNNEFEVKITTGTHHVGSSGLNVTFDNVMITITKFQVKGTDESTRFTSPIELLLSADDYKEFRGKYRDPITNNNLMVVLKQTSAGQLSLKTSYPEIDPTNDPKKGTVFQDSIELIR